MAIELENKVKQYHHTSHMVYSCVYHVVFCPKYRRKVLCAGREVRLKEIFEQVSKQYMFDIIEMEIMPDHVHLLVDCNPRFGVMECVTKLKGVSSRIMREEFPELVSKLPSLWTRGTFISSVGAVSLETVKQYIENQKGV